ncbi:hypothetical protein ACQRBF_05810 [Peptoniphilaceae bacterium SGI.131]
MKQNEKLFTSLMALTLVLSLSACTLEKKDIEPVEVSKPIETANEKTSKKEDVTEKEIKPVTETEKPVAEVTEKEPVKETEKPVKDTTKPVTEKETTPVVIVEETEPKKPVTETKKPDPKPVVETTKPQPKPIVETTKPEPKPEPKPTPKPTPEPTKVWIEPVYETRTKYKTVPNMVTKTETYTDYVEKQVTENVLVKAAWTETIEKWSVGEMHFQYDDVKVYTDAERRAHAKELILAGHPANYVVRDIVINGPLTFPADYKKNISETIEHKAEYKTVTKTVKEPVTKTRTVTVQDGTKQIPDGTERVLVKEGYWTTRP